MTTPEASLKTKLRKAVKALGCEYHALKNPNEKYWPDAVILTPNGHTIWCEGKAEGHKKDLRYRKQKERIEGLRANGHLAVLWVGDPGVNWLIQFVSIIDGSENVQEEKDTLAFFLYPEMFE